MGLAQATDEIAHRANTFFFHKPNRLGPDDCYIRLSFQKIDIRLFFDPETEGQGQGCGLAASGEVRFQCF